MQTTGAVAIQSGTVRQAARLIDASRSVAVTGHVHPDGDSVGSMLALGLGLEQMGKKVYYVSQDGIPAKYRLLPGARRVARALVQPVDLGLAVDCSTPQMMGERSGLPEYTRAIIGIDHHQFRKPFAFELVDPNASAVGELVYLLLWTLRIQMNRQIAENLLTSIIVETNSFRLPKVRPFTFAVCAELLKTGVDFRGLVNMVYWKRSRASVLLLGRCLERASFLRRKRVIWSVLKKKTCGRRGRGKRMLIPSSRRCVPSAVSRYPCFFASRKRVSVSACAHADGAMWVN